MRAPRALACSYSSMTSTPAPSDSTKPSRSRSHGRLALVGSSLRVDIARAEQKPPTAVPTVEYSAPPAIITSASPYWIMRIARPMLCVAVVHAVTQAMFGPLRPSMIERLPDDHVDDRARHEERRDLALAAFVIRDRGLLDRSDAADAGADRDADAFFVVLVRLQAGIAQRLDRRGDAVVDERIHLLDVFRRDVLRRIEIAHLAGDARRKRATRRNA